MKNFFDAKDEKITEKAFSQSIIISVVSILLCLVMLCSITYAWFSADVSSGSNKLESGNFDLNISVVQKDGASDVTVDDKGNCTLEAIGEYTVTLELTDKTTVKGYCIVEINEKEYRTVAIVNENTKNEAYPDITAPFEFTIITEEPNTTVKFESRWGVPAEPNIKQDGKVTVEASQSVNEDTVNE